MIKYDSKCALTGDLDGSKLYQYDAETQLQVRQKIPGQCNNCGSAKKKWQFVKLQRISVFRIRLYKKIFEMAIENTREYGNGKPRLSLCTSLKFFRIIEQADEILRSVDNRFFTAPPFSIPCVIPTDKIIGSKMHEEIWTQNPLELCKKFVASFTSNDFAVPIGTE